ncbi:uncharacterized protein LOC116121521, partial [Pistacia vera]|uniref:uncharacterized protein LOC116121521 n=1 Tax=Pistacia vera TaxID=55513 RepID=UPI00126302F5
MDISDEEEEEEEEEFCQLVRMFDDDDNDDGGDDEEGEEEKEFSLLVRMFDDNEEEEEEEDKLFYKLVCVTAGLIVYYCKTYIHEEPPRNSVKMNSDLLAKIECHSKRDGGIQFTFAVAGWEGSVTDAKNILDLMQIFQSLPE